VPLSAELCRIVAEDPNCAFALGYLGVSHGFAGHTDAALAHADDRTSRRRR
jgi:hypothetical protein